MDGEQSHLSFSFLAISSTDLDLVDVQLRHVTLNELELTKQSVCIKNNLPRKCLAQAQIDLFI